MSDEADRLQRHAEPGTAPRADSALGEPGLIELALASVDEGVHGLDRQGRIVFENRAAIALLGHAPGELIGTSVQELLCTDGLETQGPGLLREALAHGRAWAGEATLRAGTGSTFPAELRCTPLKNAAGAVSGAVLTFRDVSERRRQEQLQHAESEILAMISAGTGLGAVLERAARAVEQALPGALASILVLDSNGERLQFGAAPSLPPDYSRMLDGIPVGPEIGSCGPAVSRRRRVIVVDIQTDPLWAQLRELVRPYGLRACWSTPTLDSSGEPLASLAIYFREPRAPTEAELGLLDRVTRLVGISLERLRQTEALRVSECRYRSMVELVPIAIWTEDWRDVLPILEDARTAAEGELRDHLRLRPELVERAVRSIRISGCNASTLRILEARDERDVHHALTSTYARPDGREAFVDQLVALAAGAPRCEAEITLETSTGRLVPALMSLALPQGGDDAPSVLVSLADISTRKDAESRLKERIKELNCLYRVLELTTDETLTVDEACARIASFLPASLLFPHAGVARIRFDEHEHRSEGGEKPCAATLESTISVEGTPLGRVQIGYAESLPDQQAGHGPFLAEERMLVDAIAVHIGRMAAGRRLRERLRRTEKLRATGELTGGVAHDFNNLLTVILGNAGMLAEQIEDEELAELAVMIKEAADRGAELTSRLLAFARRQPLHPKAVDVNERLAAMSRLLHRTLGEHIEIEMTCDPGLWLALVDAGQLESALLNLCLNARDAMPDGGHLRFETANVRFDERCADSLPELDAGPYVKIAVSDTGMGMDAATGARAFDPFFTTKQDLNGTGLGLSMVYGFVKQSQGHVTIESAPGEGACVTLYLPRAESAAEAPELPAEAAAPSVPERRHTILHVEDDDLVREHVAGLLRTLGYRVVTAPDGSEALKLLRKGTDIDLLFTDIVMPGGLDGARLAVEARRLRPELPVLFTSGYTQSAVVDQGLLEPGLNLLQKPYRRQELAEKLHALLHDHADAGRRRTGGLSYAG